MKREQHSESAMGLDRDLQCLGYDKAIMGVLKIHGQVCDGILSNLVTDGFT